jgi:hypothetical protein
LLLGFGVTLPAGNVARQLLIDTVDRMFHCPLARRTGTIRDQRR